MNTVRRIAKNTLVLFIAQMIRMGLGFLFEKRRRRVQCKEGVEANILHILTQSWRQSESHAFMTLGLNIM